MNFSAQEPSMSDTILETLNSYTGVDIWGDIIEPLHPETVDRDAGRFVADGEHYGWWPQPHWRVWTSTSAYKTIGSARVLRPVFPPHSDETYDYILSRLGLRRD